MVNAVPLPFSIDLSESFPYEYLFDVDERKLEGFVMQCQTLPNSKFYRETSDTSPRNIYVIINLPI